VLQTRIASISDGFARFDIFVNGDTASGVQPVATSLASELQTLASSVVSGQVKVELVRLPCVAPAIQDAITTVGQVAKDLQQTYTGQLTMMGIVGVEKK
jgi:hypothetical protein